MGQSRLYADAYLVWQRRTQAQKTWVAFKTYWKYMFQAKAGINKLTAENVVLGENSAVESESHYKKLDAEMVNLVAIMSSDKSQVKTLLTTNEQLAKRLSKKDAMITRLTNEIKNLVNIITKIASKKMPLTTAITRRKNCHLTGQGRKSR